MAGATTSGWIRAAGPSHAAAGRWGTRPAAGTDRKRGNAAGCACSGGGGASMTQRGALYARVSTARQEQEQTVASQVAALEQAADAQGVTVAAEHRYIDEGVSGARLDRPGLDALRDAAADGLLDVVLIYCPDRLARSYVHQHVLIEELPSTGCTSTSSSARSVTAPRTASSFRCRG